ncbi:MAG: CoA transferase [Rhizobiales bacterium]|nr:CoA transferase [Hyphomicrobiales bacterium]NRB14767.1 CoA transferase [Hyphomicrobiales bacterium]
MANDYPLKGVKVLDLSRVLAGPWASQTLADLGAIVLKIEKPNGGDDTRSWGPPYISHGDEKISAYFCAANRGKKSICVDISSPEGQLKIRALLADCDILIENFKVGGLKKYGLDYETLKADFPRLIYCSITGFGQTGPDAHKPGYDFMIQAMGGLMSITGDEASGPMKVGVAVTDLFTGMYAVTAIQAAMIERFGSGLGQHIDLALFDCQLAMLANQGSNSLNSQITPKLMGNRHPNIVPYQSFKSQDGYFILAIGNDIQFSAFCALLGETWAQDERFATNENRVVNRDLLADMIGAALSLKSTSYWLEILAEQGIPAGRINNVDEALAEPQAIARDMVIDVNVAGIGQVRVVGTPIKMSRSRTGADSAPPRLNQHGEDV